MKRLKKNIIRIASALIFCCLSFNCVEPIELVIPNRKSMVIEATLTNEVKKHKVLLSLPYTLDNGKIAVEEGATVKIMDANGNEFMFTESEPGTYLSNIEFAAQLGVEYQLFVATREGRNYRSKMEKFESEAIVSDVSAERTTNFDGKDGIQITVNGSGANSEFFRYTYEETYKIIAPKYVGLDYKLTNYDPCTFPISFDLEIVPREEQQQICYGYRESTKIIQASTSLQNENELGRYAIKFVTADDFVLSHRYSILVKQHVQSIDAYSYYNTLKDISTSDNVFSTNQPGFLQGNLSSDEDEDELVLGYFEVASVSSKRLFFNYEDFFPDEPLPDYPARCEDNFIQPMLVGDAVCEPGGTFPHSSCGPDLLNLISENLVAYSSEVQIWGECEGPFISVPRVCGDCTELGSNQVPEFWIE